MPTAPFERFVVPSDGCKLAVKSYKPAQNAHPGTGVVLVHGLLSSADIFDLPGSEETSLARWLQREGIHAVSYDQRGAGESTVTNWTFGMREHTLVDLPAVLAFCREKLGLERVVFAAHSLGGTIWIRYLCARLAAAARAGVGQGFSPAENPAEPAVVGGAVIASPAIFDHEHHPWADLFRAGQGFIESIDHNRDQIVAREEFVGAQVWLYWPRRKWLFLPGGLRVALWLGGKSKFVAGRLRRMQVPALIYHRDDFDDRTFKHVLGSKTIDHGPHRLLLELYAEIVAGPPAQPLPRIDFPALAISSSRDDFVPLHATRVFADQFTSARFVATEEQYGEASGHVGYLFKASIRDRVMSEIVTYVRERLASS